MHTTQKIGLIAGQGDLPLMLLSRWESTGIVPVLIGLEGVTDTSLVKGRISKWFKIGHLGKMVDFLKEQGVTDLVLAGSLGRPNLMSVQPDWRGFLFILKIMFRCLGDDALLKIVRRELELYGFKLQASQTYLPELMCPEGVLTQQAPSHEQIQLIKKGFALAKIHGRQDKGQSVVIAGLNDIGYEGVEGTDSLMKIFKGKHAILIKVCKPQQDRALDMPTIGPKTIQLAHECGFSGIVAEAGETLILHQEEVLRMCREWGIFFVGEKGHKWV